MARVVLFFLEAKKILGRICLCGISSRKAKQHAIMEKGRIRHCLLLIALFFSCFPEFFSQFSKKSEKRFSQELDGLENAVYKGTIGKATRYFSRQHGKHLLLEGLENPLFLEFAQFLEKKLPCILYLEDLHNADLATLRLLAFLLDAFSHKPLFFLFTASPEVLDNPELPLELRGGNISAMMKIKALQRTVRPKIAGRDPKQLLQEIAQRMDVMDFYPIDEKNLTNIIKKLLNLRFSEKLLARLIGLMEGSFFSFYQVLVYLSQNILVHNGKKWQLKYAEDEIVLPIYLEELLKENLQDISTDSLLALQHAACFVGPLDWDLWKNTQDHTEEKWQSILQESLEKGILQQYPDKNTLVFANEKQREAILRESKASEKMEIHTNWAMCIEKLKFPAYFSLHFLKNGIEPQDSLNPFLQAGWNAELSGCYEEGYEFYKEASKCFPELKEMLEEEKKSILGLFDPYTTREKGETQKSSLQKMKENMSFFISSNIQKRKKQTQEEIKERLYRILSLYRLVAIDAEDAIFDTTLQRIIKKIVYAYSPQTFFPLFAPLSLYLLKVCHWNKKAYPREDILFFFDILTQDILFRRDYTNQIFFWQEMQKAQIQSDSERRLFGIWEKKAKQESKNPLSCSLSYIQAAQLAKQSKAYFHAARLLYTNIQYIGQNLETPGISYLEIESLRQLGIVYEKAAKEEEQEEKKHFQATQAIAAYIDCVNQIWRIHEHSWLACKIIDHALEVCQIYSLENDMLVSLQKKALSKKAVLYDGEYTGKVLVLAGQEEISAVEIVEKEILEEGVFPEILLGKYDIDLQKLPQEYSSLILITSQSSPEFKDFWKTLPGIIATSKRYESYYISENSQYPCFFLLGKEPLDTLETTVKFSQSKKLSSYI